MMLSLAQTDAVSDLANAAVGLLTAVATLVAVLVSVQSSRRSREDALQARADAAEAQGRTAAAEERAAQAAEDQVAASARISETERELEMSRRSYNARVDAERKAARQAVDVRVETEWGLLHSGEQIAVDGYAEVAVRVVNESASLITDVQLRWDRPTHGTQPAAFDAIEYVEGGATAVGLPGVKYVAGRVYGQEMSVHTAFTDTYGDRWLLQPDRSLLLLNPRHIDQADGDVEASLFS
jgi:hypothetical protein